MSSFGLIEKNMELSHIHLAVLLKKWLYCWQIEKNASIFFFKRASITATPSNQRFLDLPFFLLSMNLFGAAKKYGSFKSQILNLTYSEKASKIEKNLDIT